MNCEFKVPNGAECKNEACGMFFIRAPQEPTYARAMVLCPTHLRWFRLAGVFMVKVKTYALV